MKLTEHFALEEFTRSTTADRLKIDNSVPVDLMPNIQLTVIKLESVRKALDKPINITSGYRCPALNAQVGGVSTSAHTKGLAVNFHSSTDKHLRWGFPECFNRIKKLGYKWNHKRVYRVYCELKLNIRIKRKKCIPPRSPEKLSVADKQGKCWSMDFMSDSSRNQHRFRTFNVIDDFNREALGIDIAVCLPARRVTRYLDKLAQYHVIH